MRWTEKIPLGMAPDDGHIGAWVCDACRRRLYESEAQSLPQETELN
jgi:hypothetical protein